MLQFDVRERAACRAALEADVAAHGAYYGVVCCAGVTRDAAFPALTEEDWDVVIETGLDSFYNVVHPLTMPMVRAKQGGRIVDDRVGIGRDRAIAARSTTARRRPA